MSHGFWLFEFFLLGTQLHHTPKFQILAFNAYLDWLFLFFLLFKALKLCLNLLFIFACYHCVWKYRLWYFPSGWRAERRCKVLPLGGSVSTEYIETGDYHGNLRGLDMISWTINTLSSSRKSNWGWKERNVWIFLMASHHQPTAAPLGPWCPSTRPAAEVWWEMCSVGSCFHQC